MISATAKASVTFHEGEGDVPPSPRFLDWGTAVPPGTKLPPAGASGEMQVGDHRFKVDVLEAREGFVKLRIYL